MVSHIFFSSGRELSKFGWIIPSLLSAYWDIREGTKAMGKIVLLVKSRATWIA